VLVFLSVISYNLYLWHQPVARFLRDHHVPKWSGADEHSDPAWGLPFTLLSFAAMLIVATFITYGLERPILYWRRRGSADGPALPRADATPA
jgi:peptidoglycan/LPS O-acetylase OafA/YrhL